MAKAHAALVRVSTFVINIAAKMKRLQKEISTAFQVLCGPIHSSIDP